MPETTIESYSLTAARSHADFVFYIHELGERVYFSAHVDTGRLPVSDAEALFRSVERMLVAAATRDDELVDWASEVEVKPVVRDADWVLIDNSWIHLPTTRQFARDAIGDNQADLFALPGDPPRLGLFIASRRDSTPYSLHEACLAQLPGTLCAMAPHWYTICATAPGHARDLAAWRRQPVTAAGSGRNAAAWQSR